MKNSPTKIIGSNKFRRIVSKQKKKSYECGYDIKKCAENTDMNRSKYNSLMEKSNPLKFLTTMNPKEDLLLLNYDRKKSDNKNNEIFLLNN